ncbi:Zn-ribbon domain-containing OB-fold protein [Aquihabitans sp. G128]|uniref:Zn-ribbon domain-containing OB-fold protein n=1 Tax=Aquihabitans sp. G128 TaxID=2849779 RepID=UPI001C233FB8|nr:Zn-ribbon domain-containing OB-fold protein [Aquihabitans sp. G128]QXC62912.1 Zn-ribbon domain-containing OB-fold protein [Aquihabitans sp. G128]
MPPEISLPASLQDVEQVRSVRTPARLDYEFTAGEASSRFLKGITQKKIIGQRATPESRVYVPPRGADPELGATTPIEVEVAQVGTVTSFCMVNVAFYGSVMELPYTSALILLDGADLSIMHLIQEIPADEVRIGMRVEAVWRDDADIEPTLESIKWFRPNGEPDDPNVRIPGEDHGTGLGSWVGGVAPTEALIRNPRTGEGGQA